MISNSVNLTIFVFTFELSKNLRQIKNKIKLSRSHVRYIFIIFTCILTTTKTKFAKNIHRLSSTEMILPANCLHVRVQINLI